MTPTMKVDLTGKKVKITKVVNPKLRHVDFIGEMGIVTGDCWEGYFVCFDEQDKEGWLFLPEEIEVL